jgi:hypothetical protein
MGDGIRIGAITGIHLDTTKDVVHIECMADEKPAHIDLPSGALSTLILGLRQVSKAFPTDPQDFSGQPLVLTGAGLIAREDGQLVLELVFDQSLRVVVDVPEAAIPPLHECLFAISELRDRPLWERSSITWH